MSLDTQTTPTTTLQATQLARIPATEYQQVYNWAREKGLIDAEDTAVYFYSLDQLDSRLTHLRQVFPERVKHAIAIKTNPLVGLLEYLQQKGFGLEAASVEEVHLALAAGCPTTDIIFDSPVKRKAEIDFCESECPRLILNANCLEELPRLATRKNLRLGLRINPLIDTGAPEVFDVSQKASKFGVPISRRQEIIQAFLDYPDLEGLHMHIGSQISKMDATAKAVRQLYELGKDIQTARQQNKIETVLTYMDIGGGFPATYEPDTPQTGMDTLVSYIQEYCPEVFTKYEVFTEFGRFVHAHNGWVVSDVEYVTAYQEQPIAMVHAGADMFVREIYQPGSPRHTMSVLDANGRLKTTEAQPVNIAGPLCFAGDFLDKDKLLANIEAGDKLVIADAGANAIGMWSRHCSRACPKVITYSLQRENIQIIKARETIQDILRFWT